MPALPGGGGRDPSPQGGPEGGDGWCHDGGCRQRVPKADGIREVRCPVCVARWLGLDSLVAVSPQGHCEWLLSVEGSRDRSVDVVLHDIIHHADPVRCSSLLEGLQAQPLD